LNLKKKSVNKKFPDFFSNFFDFFILKN